MPTRAECVCCQNKKFILKMPSGVCITQHPDFPMLVNTVHHLNIFFHVLLGKGLKKKKKRLDFSTSGEGFSNRSFN